MVESCSTPKITLLCCAATRRTPCAMLNRSPASRYPNTSLMKQLRGCGRYSTKSKWNGLRRIAVGFENRHAHSRTGEDAPSGRRSDPVSARLAVPALRICRKSIVGVCGSFATANR